MKKLISLFLLVFITIPFAGSAQRWKRQRFEFSLGIGASNFLGELGGANQIGTNYFKDLEWSQTRLAFAAGLRYKLSNYFALNSHLTYGRVSGNDNLTTEPFRSFRNLSFFSNLYEININFEGAFQQEQIGHRYRLRRVKGVSGYELYTYGFAGIGVFYYDPKAEFKGSVVELRPLHTEGQGEVPTRKVYSSVGVCIPVGLGFKYTIDRYWGVGLELGIRKTFTDYIDDVSTTYFYDKATNSTLSSQLGNRSDYSSIPVGDPYNVRNSTQVGQQRGDPRDKDSYMFAIFSVNYKLTRGRGGLPRF